MKGILPISLNAIFWSIIGGLRYLNDKDKQHHSKTIALTGRQLTAEIKDVAICVPAHNEQLVIEDTILSLQKLVPARQIYVVSDGSTDQTARLARRLSCSVLELIPGLGKAQALHKLMYYFNLLNRYRYILIADADTIFDQNFLRRALPLINKHQSTAVVAAYTKTRWPPRREPNKNMLFIAYRSRLYGFIQPFIMYGQTWRPTNVYPVIPGFACLYKSDILRRLDIDVPGIIIEDFNMAFQLHKKRLGTIAHHPSIIAATQDPDNFQDYLRQIQRWNLGFFQTIKHWGVWPSAFWLALSISMLEMFIFSILLFVLPVLLILLAIYRYAPPLFLINSPAAAYLNNYAGGLLAVYLAILLADYLITLYIAFKEHQDKLAIYGLAFIFLRYLDAAIFLSAFAKAFFTTSSGAWTPPTRRAQ